MMSGESDLGEYYNTGDSYCLTQIKTDHYIKAIRIIQKILEDLAALYILITPNRIKHLFDVMTKSNNFNQVKYNCEANTKPS